jgi:dTDP-4-dehydrorhamnose reductase
MFHVEHRMEKEKILILGASSKLAQAMIRTIKAETNYKVFISSGNEYFINFVKNEKVYLVNPLNIKDVKSLCFEIKPNIVINSIGLSDVEQCETEKKLAWDLNVGIVTNLVSICKVLESHLITFSTDNIYDGERGPYDEFATPNPINNFGKTKLAAENVCSSQLDYFTILRLTPFFGWAGFDKHDFVTHCLVKLKNNESFTEPDWRFSNPVLIDDVAAAIVKILEKKSFGIYNLGGMDYISKYQAARSIARSNGFYENLIQVETSPVIKKKDRIPHKAGLVTLRTEVELGVKPTPFENALVTSKYQKNISSKYMSSQQGFL